jgi:RHS repeat-associated protein
VSVSRLRRNKHPGPSAKTNLFSTLRFLLLIMAVAAGICVPHPALANWVTATITGTMNSGQDVTGVFGFAPGTGLTGKSFTLTVTFDDTIGSPSTATCTGGTPTYYTANTSTTSVYPAVTSVLTITGGSVPFVMGKLPISSVSQTAFRYAPTTCSSNSSVQFYDSESYAGAIFNGQAYMGNGTMLPSSGHVITTDPIWNHALATFTDLSASNALNFLVNLTLSGTVVHAYGQMNTTSLTITSSAAPSPVPPAAPTYKPKNQGNQCLNCGNPVNPGTGNKFQAETDYVGAPSTQLSLTRYYNSYASASTPFGTGWTSNWHKSISGPVSSVVSVTDASGRIDTYTQSGSSYVPDPDVTSVLTAVMSGGTQVGWQLVRADDSTEQYNMSGQLTSVTTRAGLTTALTYTSGQLTTVTGPFGQTLTFTYNTGGNIATMTDANSQTYTYAYGPFNNLQSVTYPDSSVRSYMYQDPNYPNLLTGIWDELTNPYANFTYDSTGRALTTQHAGGVDLWTFTYNTGGTITATDGLSNAHTYTTTTGYDLVKPSSMSGTPYPPAGGQAFTYDSNGFVASITDFDSNVTNYTHDSRGNETQRVEAYGSSIARTINTTWSSTFHLPTQIAEPARTTNFTYDSNGNMLTKAVTDGTNTHTWTYTYNSSGQVLTAQDPDSNTTTYTYNTDGTMATMVNAASQTTTYNTYDGNKRLTKVTDPNGLITQFTYDYRGRMLTKVVGSLTTTYAYDTAGNLTKVTQPDGSYLAYTYDAARRVTKITDKLGNYTTYTYDAMSNKTAVNVYDSTSTLVRTHSYTYDAVNRLASDTGATSGETTSYTYDNQSNLLTVTDPLSHVYTYTYDALNRKATAQDPASNTTTYGYDSENNLTSVQDPRSLTTTYGYDAFGNQTSVSSPDTGSTALTFDAMGNVLTSTDARSDVSTFTYDALNRLATSSYTGGASATYTYDTGTYGKGHLTEVSDGTGNTQWTWDQYGRPTQRAETVGTVTLTNGYSYDTSGRFSTLTLPSGKTAVTTYDTQGNILKIVLNSSSVAQTAVWMPFGPIKSFAQANGKTLTRSFDQDYRITSLAYGTLNTQSLTWDNASRVTALTETSLSNKSYSYDSLDRLTGITIGTASPTSYAYDANGNRTSVTDPSSNVTTYNYPSGNNKLSSLSGFVSKTFSYDSNGNMTGDGTNTWTYDQRGRMATNVVGGTTTTYSVSDIGLRVKKAGTTTTLYAYDEAGHTIGEYTSTGTPVMETAYLGDLPVGVLNTVSGTTKTYSATPDWLGAPHIISNVSATYAWTWDHLAWGDNAPNQNPGGLGTFVYNWRFPGQTYDVESGLSYNRARDYSSTLGRYVESDPIGLSSGEYSTYAYAGNKPLQTVDPKGLCKIQVGYTLIANKVSVTGTTTNPVLTLEGQYHTFIITSDSKSDRVFHASPQWYPLPYGYLKVAFDGGDANNSSTNHYIDTVRDDGQPCECSVNPTLQRDASVINSARIAYSLYGPNSNSAVNYALQTLGINYAPVSDAPGWTTSLPMSSKTP